MPRAKCEGVYPHQDHRLQVESLHDERIELLDNIGIEGFVVDGKRGDDFWNKIRAFAIPLKPVDEEGNEILKKVRDRYGEDVFFVLIPDEEVFGGWACRAIIPQDLDKDWKVLLKEGREAIKAGDDFLSEMKRHAAMLVTGWVDTK